MMAWRRAKADSADGFAEITRSICDSFQDLLDAKFRKCAYQLPRDAREHRCVRFCGQRSLLQVSGGPIPEVPVRDSL